MTISMGETDWERGYKDAWAGRAPDNPNHSRDYNEGYNTAKMRRALTNNSQSRIVL